MHLDEFRAPVASLTRELAVVSVSGELNLDTAKRVQTGIDEAGTVGADKVIVDLSETSFIDSAALGVLVQETKRLEGRGQSLVLVTNDPRTVRVVEATGLNRVLRTYATLHDAFSELAAEPPDLAATAR